MSSTTKPSKSKQKPTVKMTKEEKQDATKDRLEKQRLGYTDSTQFKYWLFSSPSIIRDKRLQSFKKQIIHLKSHCKDFDTKYLIPSEDEYLSSLSYYAKEIIEICRKFRFPHYVSCTAVSYFKRFFLNEKYNLINIDAMCMKDTAIYLASKTEQSLFTGIDQLTQVTKIPSSQVVNHELILLDGINFHLKIWNPFRSFRSFLSDFKIIWKKKEKCILNKVYEEQIIKQGYELIQDSFISDVCLIYTPSQIALSCLLLVISCIDIKINNNKKIENDICQLKKMSIFYFDFRFNENKERKEKLKETTKVIQNMIIDGVNKTNHKNYAKLQKNANTKIFKLQGLLYQIKNKSHSNNKNNNNNNTGSKNNNVKKEKKKKIKLKIKNKKRKAANYKNNSGLPPIKRQKTK